MTLKPMDIAKLDQNFAKWTDWFAKASDSEINILMDRMTGMLVRTRLIDEKEKSVFAGIFGLGVASLQIAAQRARELEEK